MNHPGAARCRVGIPLLAACVAAAAAGAAFAQTPRAGAPASDTEVITLTPLAGGESASPAPGTPSLPRGGQVVDTRTVLADLWFHHQELRQRGAEPEAEALIDKAIAFMQREGLRSAPDLADAFLAEGRRDRRDGNEARALENYGLALRFDPDRADARVALGILEMRGGGLAQGARNLMIGLRGLVSDPENLFYLAGAVLLLAYLGAVLGLGLAVLLLAVRARGSFAHDLLERRPGRLSGASAPIAAAAILALPLAVPVPITWALSFWGALLLPYLRGAERALVVLTLVTLVGAGLFGAAVAWHFDTATDPTARALLQAASTGADLRHEEALKRALREHPDDPIYPFLLGSAYRLGGRPEEAMTMYRRVLTLDASNARAMVNLGNLYALRQEFAQAHALYKKAGETDPRLALARFDSHLAYLERFEMEAADAELKEARRLDPGLVDSLLQGSNEGASRRAPLDARYPPGELWGRALRLRRQPTAVTARAAAANPVALGALGGLVALLVLPGLLLAPRQHPAAQCGRCGGAYCRRCQVATKFPGFCSPCVHLFLLRDGLAPSVREAKMDEVVRFRKRQYLRTRVLSLFLPGSGHVLGGRPILGGIFLSIWAAAWAGLVLRRRFLVPPGTLPGMATATALVALALVALTAWLLANLTRQDRRDEV